MTDKEFMCRVLSLPLDKLITVRRVLVEDYGMDVDDPDSDNVIKKIDAQIEKARRANAAPSTATSKT